MSVPDKLVIRTGDSNWRLFVPALRADTTTSIQSWNPDAQFHSVDTAPANQIAKQFSYFAAYWLNRNKVAVNGELNVSVYPNGGTFDFKALNSNPVTSYQGRFPPAFPNFVNLTLQQDGVDAGYSAANGSWQILLRTNGVKPATNSLGNFSTLGNSSFKTMTKASADGRNSFGHTTGFYESFFTQKKITALALVDGTSTSVTDLTGNTNYIIYDLVESSGTETMFEIINRLDTYAGDNAMQATDAQGKFRDPSVVNFTAGTNGYSGTWRARSSESAFGSSTFPDKICVWGINIDSDDDVQVFCAYWGNLNSGKGDSWRMLSPLQTLWSVWGNDFHDSSSSRRISGGLQTSPGINASLSTYTGDVYLLAYSNETQPATLNTTQSTFYRKFVSGATVSFDVITSNAGTVARTHESSNTSILSIPTASVPSGSIVAPGKVTIKVTQPATGNYTEVIENSLITIVIVGSGITYTSEDMTSLDLSGTNLTSSVFASCNLTSANLFGATVNASTNFSTATLTSVRSGRIIGITSLLPNNFKLI